MRRVLVFILVLIFSSSLSFASRKDLRKENKEKALELLFGYVNDSLVGEARLFQLKKQGHVS